MSSIQSVAGQPGRALALEADAPRRAAVGDDLVAQRDQLVPRLGDLVAGGVEVVLRVPDHALEVDVGRAGRSACPRTRRARRRTRRAGSFSSSMSKPRSSSGDDRPESASVGDRAGLGHGGDVERAALGADLELLLEVARPTRSRRCSRSPTLISSSKIVLVRVDLLGLTGAQQVRPCRCPLASPRPPWRRRPRSSVSPARHRRRRRRRSGARPASAATISGIDQPCDNRMCVSPSLGLSLDCRRRP